MLTRRHFLGYSLLLPGALAVTSSYAETEFERYKREMQQGVQKQQDEWESYKENYLAAFEDYKNSLSKVWASPEMSSEKVWVDYSNNMQTRRSVDFEKNEVRLSFTQQDLASLDDARIQAELAKALNMTVAQAYQDDPVLKAVGGAKAPMVNQTVIGSKASISANSLGTIKQVKTHTAKGDVVTIVVPLPPTAIPERAKAYWPQVKEQAQRWKLDHALVFAIIQTESAFNPMARSGIPAFGLMQIVPTSAGRDATKHVWGKETTLTGAQLYKPETNIELGCAYLNILDTKYLAAVTDPLSRRYCVICAYNTGAGNVAKAFTGKTSVAAAAKKINSMTPAQVYAHLQRNLPHQETRDYLVRVTKRIPDYQTV